MYCHLHKRWRKDRAKKNGRGNRSMEKFSMVLTPLYKIWVMTESPTESVYILMKIPGTFFHLLIFVNDFLINTTPPPPMSREHWFTYFARSFLFQFCNTRSRCIYAYFVALRNSTNFSTDRTEHNTTPKRSIGVMHDKANAQN